ncbi:MAG: T9SS type A sorting domain-containing protein, partial [Bacteroidota bacterium]|nr:T9SS type A sorting domain-containing protein [Bacteroidota bacterium]
NNPKVGHFPYGDEALDSVTSASYTIYMPDSCFCVAAHAVVHNGTQSETAWGDGIDMGGSQWATYFTCCPPANNPCSGLAIQCSPDTVINFVMGTKSNGVSPVDPSRIDPWRATGTPENDDTSGTINFHTLGYGGTLTLGFTQGVILDVPNSPDFWVIETSFGNPECRRYPEKVNVEVSNDGSTWYMVATNVCQNGMVDIAAANDPNLCEISYVRLTDVTSPFGNTDGYDVDGIVCINQPGGGFKVAPVHPATGTYVDDLTFITQESNGIQIESVSLKEDAIYAEVLDMSGRVIAKFQDKPEMSRFFVTDNLTPGIYIVRVLVDGTMKSEKFLIQ